MSHIHNNRSGRFLLVPKVQKIKSKPNMVQQPKASKQHIETRKRSIHENSRTSRTANYRSISPPIVPEIKNPSDIIVVPSPNTSASANNQYNTYNRNQSYVKMSPQSRPVSTEYRVRMANKACHVLPDLQDAAQYTNTCTNELYQALLIEQYGFNPTEPYPSEQQKPLEKSLVTCQNPKVENSSQVENPRTTNTGTNGTTMEMIYSFGGKENSLGSCFAPKNIEISDSPRLKVIAEKFTRFKKDHIELRQLEERIVCVEYDVYCRDDIVKNPGQKNRGQMMRAYFSVKTGCHDCKAAFLNNLYVQYNVPLGDDTLQNKLETEVEIIDEKLPDNKPYLKDLQRVLKKRQAMNTKKQKSTLDLKSMYTMAYNEMAPRDHDWSHTNLLSKAELDEVKQLILRKCESRVHNLSRKKIKVKDDITMESTNTINTDKTESLCYDLLKDLDNRLKSI